MSLPRLVTYIGRCACSEWVLAAPFAAGSCGACGERPTYVGPDDGRVDGRRLLREEAA